MNDQDAAIATADIMPKLHQQIAQKGMSFERFYAPVSLCCPSRVSLLTGQYAHNHNVTYVDGPYGGYHTFCEKGYNEKYLPLFLQNAGYATYYTGKLMNGLNTSLIETCQPAGWTSSEFLVDPNAYMYYNPSFSSNGQPPVNHPGQYSVTLIKEKASAMLQQAISDLNSSSTEKEQTPFFLGIAPTAPHMEVELSGAFTEPKPAPGDENLFDGVTAPRTPNFNVQGGVSWVKGLKQLNGTVIAYIDHVYRQRLRVMQAVDDLVDSIVQQVEDAGIADNTYIIYASDNGYAMGSHCRQPGKSLPFQEDTLVPFMIRGPGIPANAINTDDIYSMPDLGATILGMANASASYQLDGKVMSFSGDNSVDVSESGDSSSACSSTGQQTIVEYWNGAGEEGIFGDVLTILRGGLRENTTYRSIRALDMDDSGNIKHDWAYGVWCTGERELYDLINDPYQINNLAINDASGFDSFNFSTSDMTKLASRLDALLVVLKTCVGEVCNNPWQAIFPSNSTSSGSEACVMGLSDALADTYDSYFESLPKFSYTVCQFGYLEDLESPTWTEAMAFSG
ncbi:arylsulfatase precursor [Dendrothele bispora CBS 962.96]|uniref:Arylsulfatase n=1 Tax=Dendrothele bispora (strain CBS 962.96) TaxID=1314807 RepID=A0A4S8LN17_DENBC|nr:arylsulfatase precursor [Dendrothele bispora CBS 962.96]